MSDSNVKKLIQKYDKEFCSKHEKEIRKFSNNEKQIFNHTLYDQRAYYTPKAKYPVNNTTTYIKKLSEYVKNSYKKAAQLLVPEDFINDFYYIIDKLNKFQYSESYNRRSFRSEDYSPFTERVYDIMYNYYLMGILGCKADNMEDFVLSRYEDDTYSYLRKYFCYDSSLVIAARIDMGDTKVINSVKEMITSENNDTVITVEIIRAVMRCSNEELHNLICGLLVAARLSEGLRQAICENADCGTAEAFIKIVKTICENNLIRFSSVKRALGTWTGICRYTDPDRYANKILEDIPKVLESKEKALEYINTTDTIHIYMGLWGLGFYNVFDALNEILDLVGLPEYSKIGKLEILKNNSKKIISATKQQLLTIGYFCSDLNFDKITDKIALAVIEACPNDYELFSIFREYYVYNGHTRDNNSNKLFRNKKDAQKHYDIMLNMYNIMPKKEISYKNNIYEWYSTSISKSKILYCMADIADFLEDDEKIDYICGHLSEIEPGFRRDVLLRINKRNKTALQRETIINAVADKESYTRNAAVNVLSKSKISDEEYIKIESFAKYKNAELRQGVIKLLKKRDDKGLCKSIKRMLSQKEENIRLAALDLLRYAISEYKKTDFTELKKAAAEIENPSEREEILINEITGNSDSIELTAENGYGIYNPNIEWVNFKLDSDINIVKNYFSVPKEEITKMYKALIDLIIENAELEYKDASGEEHLLGDCSSGFFSTAHYDTRQKVHERFPFPELWEKFYNETVKTPQRFWCMYIVNKKSLNKLDEKSEKIFKRNEKLFFGELSEFDYEKELAAVSENRIDTSTYSFNQTVSIVFSVIISLFDLKMPLEVAQNAAGYIAENFTEDEIWLKKKEKEYSWGDKKIAYICRGMFEVVYNRLQEGINEDFEKNFNILHALAVKSDSMKHYLNKDIISEYTITNTMTSVIYYIKAYKLKMISRDFVYKSFFELCGLKTAIRSLNPFMSGMALSPSIRDILIEEGNPADENNEFPKESEFYKRGYEIASNLIDKILDVELKRGDSETVFSKVVTEISAIYGMERFIQILKAFGNETFKHEYYYYGGISKKEALSHLLEVCYPTSGDNSEKLSEYLKNSKITNNRLIETAMFSPQWIDIIEEYLKIDGLKSGCYYFMAHTAEYIDKKRQAIIAKYTPLTSGELNGGCFDVNWFREAYETLGDKMFNQLYKSAKYISSSNMHTRARKYADAALGKMNINETEAAITEKRNKDLLMSLAIIPSKDKNDILQRYEFIQNFLKESKKFGVQRRASEASAVEYALKNLAVTAGYSDETRLTLSMETELVKNNSGYFSWNKIGDYEVMIEVSADGKASLKYRKGEKPLKSAPSAIKKDESFISIKQFCDKLKQQYRRTVKMFETAMEERDLFSLGELLSLCINPVTKTIVENLVFISDENKITGIIYDGKLHDYSGKEYNISDDTTFRTAHPYDLYNNGIWSEYQKYFLEIGKKEGRKQPFRQVFRELYTKLSEELEKEKSLMFAGNQIQPKRTVSALGTRRWIADYEDGLQKIYYKDDIIAGIYAVADWFSPSDIEAPTLECVTFVNRRTYMPVKMKDIPDILYSEVMRDVDLAVSVAHAGGVDPETSHSTIEMRKVILEFNLNLFGIKNVRFEKNHAIIEGKHGNYSIHLGSGTIHKIGGHSINVIAVSDGKKSKIFLPFIDEDPKTAEIMTKVITFANDDKIKDPYIMQQIK